MQPTTEELAQIRAPRRTTKQERLLNASLKLLEIVEGVKNERWAANGVRLKDTPEWVEFYLSVNPFRSDSEGPGKSNYAANDY